MASIRLTASVFASLALIPWSASAATLTPDSLTAPFGVQPTVGLSVTGGVTDPFFSDLSGLPFPGPGIVDLITGLQAFDSGGNPIGSFSVTGVTLMQGMSTLSPEFDNFSLSSPITYTSTLNPLSQVTVNPGDYNLGFVFDSDMSFQYSYTLDVSGVPDGGFLLYNDVEGAQTPEPSMWVPMGTLLTLLGIRRGMKARQLVGC